MTRVGRVFAFLALAAFTGSSANAATKTRVASLLPYVTEAMRTMPNRVEVVASADSGDGVGLPAGMISLGSPHAPNLEVLAASHPDVVVGDRQIHSLLREKLARGGAKVILIDGSSVEGTFEGLIAVADAAGAGPEMKARVGEVRAALAALRRENRAAVLPLFGTPGSFMAITSRTWLGDLLARVGFRNVAADAAGQQQIAGYVELSDETISTFHPDRVFLVTHGKPSEIEAALQHRAERGGAWRSIGANVLVLPPELFARNPGLRMAEAARQLIEMPAGRASR